MFGHLRTPDPGHAPRRILLVGDGDDIRQFAEVFLRRPGHFADRARDGRDALRLIEAAPPDLVLLDLMAPELDGWQVLRRLPRNHHPPVVAILSPFVEAARALEAGAAGCVCRPFRAEKLLRACEHVLSATGPRAAAWSAR